MSTWKKLRVVVEVPVQGDYTERDFRWDVERLIQDGLPSLTGGLRVKRFHAKVGRVLVKEMNKVLPYAIEERKKALIRKAEKMLAASE